MKKRMLACLLSLMVCFTCFPCYAGEVETIAEEKVEKSAAYATQSVVSYNVNGGTGTVSAQTTEENGRISITKSQPEKFGYTFSGWSTTPGGSASYLPGNTYTFSSDVTLYAVWKEAHVFAATAAASYMPDRIMFPGQAIWYKITPSQTRGYRFETTGSQNSVAYLYDEAGNQLKYVTKGGDGQNFRLEYNMEAGKIYYIKVKYYNSSVTGDFNFYIRKIYTVRFDNNGGSGYVEPQERVGGVSLTLTRKVPMNNYYFDLEHNNSTGDSERIVRSCIFKSWNTKEDGSGTSYMPGDTYNTASDVILYAQWENPVYGELPVPEYEGHSFEGWYTDPEAGTKITGSTVVTSQDKLYAHWKDAPVVLPEVIIETQPESVAALNGTKVSYSVSAQNAASYQWQYSKNGSTTWTNSTASGAKTNKITVTAKSTMIGYRYRCVITGVDGNSSKSKTAALFVMTQAPENSTTAVGGTAAFSLKADNVDAYQWQYSNDQGETWLTTTKMTGYNTDTLSFKVTASNKTRLYRCRLKAKISSSTYTAYTAPVSVEEPAVSPLQIVAQPEDVIAVAGQKVQFAVKAEGTGLTYQWQYSKDNGASWVASTVSSASTATLKTTVQSSFSGRLYRCIVTDGNGNTVISDTATLLV